MDFSVCPAMTVFGQQVEVRANETISGKTTLHGLTVCDFSNVATRSEWKPDQPPVFFFLPSFTHFTIFLSSKKDI